MVENKGRMGDRTIDGKEYNYHSAHKLKKDAKRIAEGIREYKGLNVRVVYQKSYAYPYALYVRKSMRRKGKLMKPAPSSGVYVHGMKRY